MTPPYRNIRYLLVAVVCALPFIFGSLYLYRLVERVDTLPLDLYADLRWAPEGKDLVFLHRPLRQDPPAETEIWRATGGEFRQIGTLPSEFDWRLSKRHAANWMLLQAKRDGQGSRWALADGEKTVKFLDVEEPWTLIDSQGDGLFFQAFDDDEVLEGAVEVEDAPEIAATATPEVPSDVEPVQAPVQLGLNISEYQPETQVLRPLFSIPFSQTKDQPIVHLVRRSPDKRFLALVVQFGESAKPGLWLFDSESRRLLWTRISVSDRVQGLDWSSESLMVALTDAKGVTILPNALGVESIQLEISTAGDLRPKWGPGTKLYLINEHIVYLVDEDRSQAEPLFDTHAQYEGFSDLVLDASSAKIAYSASPKGYRELIIRDLQSGESLTEETLPGSLKQKAQSTVAYQLGSAIRFAWNRWTGRG